MQSIGATLLATASGRPAVAKGMSPPPNIVVFVVDDMRWDVLGCAGHPVVRTPNIDRIAAHGVRFENAFVTTSLCSPSRASILTGSYAHRHGVIANATNDPGPAHPIFPLLLQSAGYRTGMIGKWHMRRDSNPRPGFDEWLSFRGQGTYLNPLFNRNGTEYRASGYMTDLLSDEAVRFLSRPHGGPFCLYIGHKAVHAVFEPAPRHRELYADATLPTPPLDEFEGKPRWLQEVGPRTLVQDQPIQTAADERKHWQEQSLAYYRTLAAVDDGVGRVLDALDDIGATAHTLVVFTSDNGLVLGEHRRGGKRTIYEESMRVPLLASGAGVRDGGRVVSDLVLNIDLAPTFLDLAGVPVPESMQGRSLAPLLANKPTKWRQSFLYEYFQEAGRPVIPTTLAVRTKNWKYARFPEIEDIEELYNVETDPHEIHNLVTEPAAQEKLAELRKELARLCRDTL